MDSKKPSTTKKVETAKKGGLDSSRESSVDKSKIKTKTTSKKSPAKKVEKPVKDSYLQKAEEEMEKDEKARAEQKLAQRKHNAESLNRYLQATGISMAFKVIFAEVIAKGLNKPEDALPYASDRLREIGHELTRVTITAKQKGNQDLNKSIEDLNASFLKQINNNDSRSTSPVKETKPKPEADKKPAAPQSTKPTGKK